MIINLISTTKRTSSLILLFLLLINSSALGQEQMERIPSSDLIFLYETLIKEHPKLHLVRHREAFDSLYNETQKGFGDLDRTGAIMEMMKLVASLNDGHTSIARAWDENTNFRRLPLRLYWFSEGIYISRIDEKFDEYLGMKIIKISSTPIEAVIKLAMPYIHGDNDMTVKDVLPSRLGQFDFLIGLGLSNSDNSISLTLLDDTQKEHTLIIQASDLDKSTNMLSARSEKITPPLYLSNFDLNYWYSYLVPEKIMYFQFNAVAEIENNSFKEFVDELFNAIDSLQVEKLVIDIRNNNGGDNTILKPLIHALIRCDKINKKGSLFTITGRLTFSAAVSLTTELEKHTETIFVGEPTAASPNHYGETELRELPSSGIKFLYSSQFWQGSLPWDDRPWIEPAIKVHESFNDYKNGRDLALEKIVKF